MLASINGGGHNSVHIDCVTLEELAAEVHRHTPWQLRFTRRLNDDDMRLAGTVDLRHVEVLVRELEWMRAVTVIALDKITHVVVLTPILSYGRHSAQNDKRSKYDSLRF